jgi:hypothetical protein
VRGSNLVRLGGLAAMVGGVLSLASLSLGLLPPFGAVAGFFLVVLAGDITLLLVPVGMLGFHALQRHGYERTGSAGFWLVVAGSLMTALGVAGFLVWGDFLQDTAPVSLKLGPLVLLVGFAVYGMATLQARMLPRWCGVAFVALPVALAADVFMPWGPFASIVVIFGLVWLALG